MTSYHCIVVSGCALELWGSLRRRTEGIPARFLPLLTQLLLGCLELPCLLLSLPLINLRCCSFLLRSFHRLLVLVLLLFFHRLLFRFFFLLLAVSRDESRCDDSP